jgi:hypothetical protein
MREEPAGAPDDVSVTGTRRAPTDRVLQRSGDDADAAALESFEQTPQRGSEDARLLVDVPERGRQDDGA